MNYESFNWGIIGPGRIAHRFAEALAELNDGCLYAVASRNEERARSFAKKFLAEKVYTSYRELVEDKNIDAIYIATPHNFHYEQTMLCLEAGKPVLCEKPLTVNATQARSLFEKAAEKGVFLMEALWTRYLPLYDQVRLWLDEGTIGKVKLLTSTFGFRFARDLQSRQLNPELAGGGLLDLGVYNIAISQWVTGMNPVEVDVHGFLGETGVDELTSVLLTYKNKVTSHFTCTTMAQCANEFDIFGSEGRIRIHAGFWDSTQATLVQNDRELIVTKPYKTNGFEYEIMEAMQCIRDGKLESPSMSYAHTLANMELMDTIRKQLGLRYPFE